MKLHCRLWAILFLLIATESFSMNEDTLLFSLMPDSSFLPVESDRVYEKDYELYDYINGGAELYLNYGFKKLARRIYKFDGDNEIKAEIFDMSAPKNAYGVFSYASQEVNIGVGQGAQYMGGSLIFWQDRYYVSVFAREESEQTKKLVRQIGKMISSAIGKTGELPLIFHTIPEKSLVKESTFYFHHHAWQNKFRYISNDNIFNIDNEVDAILNQYGEPKNRYYLLMLQYPNKKAAKKAYRKGIQTLPAKLKNNDIIQDEDGKFLGVTLENNLLLYVFDAPEKEDVDYLLHQTRANYDKLK